MSKSIRYDNRHTVTEHRRAGRPRRARRLSARAIHRNQVDTSRIARAVIEIALAEADREAREVETSTFVETTE